MDVNWISGFLVALNKDNMQRIKTISLQLDKKGKLYS